MGRINVIDKRDKDYWVDGQTDTPANGSNKARGSSANNNNHASAMEDSPAPATGAVTGTPATAAGDDGTTSQPPSHRSLKAGASAFEGRPWLFGVRISYIHYDIQLIQRDCLCCSSSLCRGQPNP